jgi:hypothetical protein
MQAYRVIREKLAEAEAARTSAEHIVAELAKSIRGLKTADVNPNMGAVKSSDVFRSGNWSARAHLAELASTDENRQYELVARAVEAATTPEKALEVVDKAVMRRKADWGESASLVHLSEKAAKRIAETTGSEA